MRIDTAMMLQQSGKTDATRRLMAGVMEKLSTGLRVNRASDDAAGLAIAKRLEAMARGYKRAGMNIEDAMSALQIADGGASTMSDILQRQRELALQASSDTLTDQDRAALDREYQQLNAELKRITDSTQFNTMDLLNGNGPLANGSGVAQVGPGASAENQMNLPNTDMTAASAGWGGSIATAAGARSAVNSIDGALDRISGQRAQVGATVNRLDVAGRNNAIMEINTVDAQSRIADLDYAQGLMDWARSEILSRGAIYAQRHFNQISRHTILGLLQ